MFLDKLPQNQSKTLQNSQNNFSFIFFTGKPLDYKGYGIATSKNSKLINSINSALLNLINERIPEKLAKKWWNSQCPEKSGNAGAGTLTLANVVGVFFFLAGFLVLAMFIALLEFCFKSNVEAKKAKTSISDAMKTKARMALKAQGGREIESMRFYGDSSALWNKKN